MPETLDTHTGVIAFVPHPWDGIWHSRHHVLWGLEAHVKVLWVAPPSYVQTWRRQGASAALAGRGLRKLSDRFWTYAPRLPADYSPRYTRSGMIPSLFRRYRRWWERRHATHIRQLQHDMGIERVILYLWRPDFAKYADLIPHDLLCYHIDDEYSFDPSQDVPASEEETQLLKRADTVFIHSRSLLEKKGHVNPNTHYIPNGVHFDRFRGIMEDDTALPEDLAGIPSPRIGYVGYVKRHIDLPLLLEIARKRRDWSLVLVGPVRAEHTDIADDVAALRAEPNVHFMGGKDTREIPRYIKGFDVCLLCYRQTNYTKYIYPMKLHEYLAGGKPVVATPLDNLVDFKLLAAVRHRLSARSKLLAASQNSAFRTPFGPSFPRNPLSPP